MGNEEMKVTRDPSLRSEPNTAASIGAAENETKRQRHTPGPWTIAPSETGGFRNPKSEARAALIEGINIAISSRASLLTGTPLTKPKPTLI